MGIVAEMVGLYPVRVLPGDRVFLVAPSEDVLTAGLRQGVDLRYGCRHGKCTTCKYVVVEGDVVHHGASPYAFSDRELEEGGVLLCSTFARSPLVISPFGGQLACDGAVLIPPQEYTATVLAVEPVSPELVELCLQPDSPLSYRPGQYVEIDVVGRGPRGSYSMTGPPGPAGELRFLIDAAQRRVLAALADARGQPVGILGPFGRFYHHPAKRPVLLVATGAGLGPILAILREELARPDGPPVHLFYGAGRDGIPTGPEYEAIDYSPVELLGGGRSRLGPIVRRIGQEIRDASGCDAYIAGPVELCDAVESLLTAKGLPERRCFVERFY
ncbi:MAG TPA: 2Fe-2S iron-sulfur cluster-binding protein [Acidimicrobiia bacterium]|nr:2Fe-2S iron-sulfur cluster-binding protein [Acidimicrobiia bacterium]